VLALGGASTPDVSRAGAPPAPAQSCTAEAVRKYGGVDPDDIQWGDEVNVTVEAVVKCAAGTVSRLGITETLPPGIDRVDGIGRAPDAVSGRGLTWRFENPAVEPGVVRFTYRVYATPDWNGFDAEGKQTVAWPMALDLTAGGRETRQAAPDVQPMTVRERRDGLGCGLSRVREIRPTQVLAGQAFDVKLRVTLNQCAAFAHRTRQVTVLQPLRDADELLRLAQVHTALLDPQRVSPEKAMFGAVINLSEGPRVQMPTSEFIFVEDLVRALQPVPDGGADAAAGLRAALDLLADWPVHHEVILYITHPAAPRADPAAVSALVAEAARRGVELVAVCVGGGAAGAGDCDPALSYAYRPADLRVLRRDVVQGMMDKHRGPPLEVEAIEIEERLLKFVQVAPGSVFPAARVVGGNLLQWRVEGPAVGVPFEVGYRASIDIWGRLPIGIGGLARAVYAGGGQHSFDLPKGSITVDRDPNAVPKPCRPVVDKHARPARVPLGEPVEVRLDFGAECPTEFNLIDVMLVLDVSGSMSGGKIDDARRAALAFLDVVVPGLAQVGLVTFDHEIQRRLPLSASFDAVRAEIQAMQASGGTDIAQAIGAAGQELLLRRAGATPVMIVMTDGFNNGGPQPVLDAALQAKGQGALIVTICFGGQCDGSLPDVASAPQFYYEAVTADDLLQLFVDLGVLLRQMGLASARIVDELPAHMRFVPGSAQPPPTDVQAPAGGRGQTLVWDFADPPLGGVSVRYLAEPLILGEQPTNTRAVVNYVDDNSREGSAVFPVPLVETFIPVPKGPCTPALGKTADRTRVDVDDPVGIQLTVRLDCPRRGMPMDIVLVVDHSDSMRALDRLVNAKAAAGAFLDPLDPVETRVGLVSFSSDVTGRVPLTHSFGQVRAAVDALRPGGQTGISQALNAARDLLAARRPEALGAVILLTDGANTAGPELMLAAADRLKNTGTTVVAVCAGECDDALPAVASKPAYAFDVQESARLVALFRDLAFQLTRDKLRDLTVTDSFPTAIEVDPASFNPAPTGRAGDTVVWTFADLPDAGLALRYTVRPKVAGRVPANRFARLDYGFGLETGSAFFPVPVLEVGGAGGGTGTATPTNTPHPTPTPTVTRPPTSTGTPRVATPTAPSPTPTPAAGSPTRTPGGPFRCYLPVVARE